MANNWAIVIGINQYRFLQPLRYAKRDAEAMSEFLKQEARFDRIFLFTDDSPEIGGKPTEPFRANLLRVLRQIFAQPFMKDGDNFWFFFSGHGIRHNEQDYLMPLDGDPEDVENTGIPTQRISNYLRSCGADNVVMILDACRSGGKKSGEGIGKQTEEEARQTGVISIFSCSPDQYSYELESIAQGAFTYALIEGLGIRSRCATVERLNQYLQNQVPQLVQQLGRVRQSPYTIAEPIDRSHLILMPQHATLADIATLKNDAYRAQVKQDWNSAQRLWIRVLAAASGQDMEAIEALQTIAVGKANGTIPTQPQPVPEPSVQPRSATSSTSATQAQTRTVDEDNLSSERFGANYYAKLRDLLKTEDWKRADHETSRLMCEIVDKPERALKVKDIESFPIRELRIIDQLWTKYSKGKFGFSVQKQIWRSCGSPRTYGEKWDKFGDTVGWRKNGEWDRWGYSLNHLTPPVGHFPRDFAFRLSEGGTARGNQPAPVSLTSKLLGLNFQIVANLQSKIVQDENLSSERFGANYYNKLRDLLKAGKWKEADQETNDRMCEVMDRQREGWLDIPQIEKFPCQDLKNIDRLWVKYSNDKFGFSVQKRIWQECGSPTAYNEDWKKFCDRVGWRVNERWIAYSEVKFNTSAPGGHLPQFEGGWLRGRLWCWWFSSLAAKLVKCSKK